MLVNLTEPLNRAAKKGEAVAAFNVYNPLTIRSALMAARKENSPVITAFGASYLKFMHLNEVQEITEYYSRKTGQDTVLHLDHCSDPDVIERALMAGFSSVMFDGSRLSFSENMRLTAEVVRMAHGYKASVEAELGSLATGEFSHEGKAEDREQYTDPDRAVQFVEATGIDALAVSIGTVHGMYKSKPDIRIDILNEINKKVVTPLVLHGASGTPLKTIRDCIDRGIRKINVNTEVSQSVTEFINSETEEKSPHFSELYYGCGQVLEERMGALIREFSA